MRTKSISELSLLAILGLALAACSPERPPSAPQDAVHTGTRLEPGLWVNCGDWTASRITRCEKHGFQYLETGEYYLARPEDEPTSDGRNTAAILSLRSLGYLDALYVPEKKFRMRPITYSQTQDENVIGGFSTLPNCLGKNAQEVILVASQAHQSDVTSHEASEISSKIFGDQEWTVSSTVSDGVSVEYDLVGTITGNVSAKIIPGCVAQVQKIGSTAGL